MGEHSIDGAVSGEVFKSGSLRGAENDEAGVQFVGCGENFNGRIAVDDARFDAGEAAELTGTGGLSERVEVTDGGGVDGGHGSFAGGRRLQNMQQDEPRVFGNGDLAGKCGARAGGLSKRGGVENDSWSRSTVHREMGLGSHG